MTREELDCVAQMIQRFVPWGTAWILVAMPPHDLGDHLEDCGCPLQTASNLGGIQAIRSVLNGAAAMFDEKMQGPSATVPVERGQ